MAGRVIDHERARAVILQALRSAATREAAAEYAGIDRITLWRWLKEDETFATEVRNAEASWQVQATALMLKAAVGGSWQAAQALLERHPQSKHLWKRIDQHDMSVIPTPRLLEMLAAIEEGVDPPGDRAAGEEAELRALPEPAR